MVVLTHTLLFSFFQFLVWWTHPATAFTPSILFSHFSLILPLERNNVGAPTLFSLSFWTASLSFWTAMGGGEWSWFMGEAPPGSGKIMVSLGRGVRRSAKSVCGLCFSVLVRRCKWPALGLRGCAMTVARCAGFRSNDGVNHPREGWMGEMGFRH